MSLFEEDRNLSKKTAFTLIELLVVIAIIAILAAILFPVFAQAKAAAKKTQNISNQKQVATAVIMYCGDSDDVVPMSAYFSQQGTIFSVYDAVQPYLKNTGVFTDPSYQPGIDWPARLQKLGLKSAGTFRFTGYVPNLGLFGENFCPFINKRTIVVPLGSIDNPSGTIMFFDGYMKDAAPLEFFNFLGYARHTHGLVLNFTDSSAKWYKYSGIPTGGPTPAGSLRPTYYSWRTSEPLRHTDKELQDAPSTAQNPYNDLHGVPGSDITDSEDLTCQ